MSDKLLDKKVLILNANYKPLSYYPLSINGMKNVIKKMLKNRLIIVEEYDETININGMTIHLPKTAALKEYKDIYQAPKFNRYNVYLRDKFTCQYCGKRFQAHELTYDHLVPKAKGGKTEWCNIITACKDCNCKKGCKDAKGKYIPLSLPHIPSNAELLRNLKELQIDVGIQIKNWEQWIMNI